MNEAETRAELIDPALKDSTLRRAFTVESTAMPEKTVDRIPAAAAVQ